MPAHGLDLFDLCLHIPAFLDRDQCRGFVDVFDSNESRAVLENSIDTQGQRRISTFRCVIMPDHSEPAQMMRDHVRRAVQSYRDYLIHKRLFHDHFIQNTVFNYVRQFRLLRYGPGQSIHPHVDHDPWIYGSVTINLNEDYTGGDFVFMNGMRRFRLGSGDALIFPADIFWVHEIEPVTQGHRYSFNCFLQSIPRQHQLDILGALPDLHHLRDDPTYINDPVREVMTWH